MSDWANKLNLGNKRFAAFTHSTTYVTYLTVTHLTSKWNAMFKKMGW